jgi:hypothetical protein
MQLISERASHWYDRSGNPCHEVPKKDGKGMKAVTVKEARVMGLLPSVTNILGVCNKPQLNDWRVTQAILAGITLPRPRESMDEWKVRIPAGASSDEVIAWAYANPPKWAQSDDDFARLVAGDTEAQVGAAADFGSRIHAAIEEELTNPEAECPADLEPYLAHWRQWSGLEIEDVYSTEKTVVCTEYGYAGKLDLYCRLRGIGEAVVDFKTQKVRNGRPAFYDEWYMQLGAYAFALFQPGEAPLSLVSVVIDSGTPGPVAVKQWPEPHRGFELFRNAFALWKYQKDYDPCEIQNADSAPWPK